MVLTPPTPSSQGDLKRYLRAQRPPEGLSPELPPRDLRTLQRMGLEIARGLAHLHSHNYVHRWLPGRGAPGKSVQGYYLGEGGEAMGVGGRAAAKGLNDRRKRGGVGRGGATEGRSQERGGTIEARGRSHGGEG